MNTESSTRKVVLSIIIPVYNVEAYIFQCLDSIFTEETATLPYEVIVVNDGTQDNSMAIVEQFSERHEKLHVISQKNQGLSAARNAGFAIAQGEYVWFVDSDDWLSANAVDKVLEVIDDQPKTDIFATPIVWKHSYGDYVEDFKISGACCGIDYLKRDMSYTPVQRFIIKRSFLKAANISFYPNIYHEDVLFGAELLYAAKSVYVYNNPMYQYRENENGLMHTVNIKKAYDLIVVHKEMIRYMYSNVSDADKSWWQCFALLRFEESHSVAWMLRGTAEYNEYMRQTKAYRKQQCDHASHLGGWRWKVKCWLFKHPAVNKYRRILLDKIF